MTALSRQQVKIFASNALSSQVTAFRTTEEESPTFSKTPDVLQSEKYVTGWLNADNTGNVAPHVEDFNGLFLTSSYLTAYLYEKGIPEYLATQTYYINSFCQYQGKLYRCKVDNTVNYLPTDTSKWDELSVSAYTASNIGTGDYSIYAGTNSAGTEFQFKKLIAGTNVTMLETDDSLTINSTQGTASFTANSPLSYSAGVLSISQASSSSNGYLSSADWTSFNSKLSSTIFSDTNTWTGTNTFSGLTVTGNIITNANDTYSIGDATNRFNLYAQAINAYGSSYFVNLYPSSNNTYKLGSDSAYWSQLYAKKIFTGAGNGIYFSSEEGKSYIKDVTANTLEVHATSSINLKAGDSIRVRCTTTTLRPEANKSYDLGDTTHYWRNLYTGNIYFDSVQIYHVGTDNKSLQIMWQNGSTNVAVYMQNATFRPYSNNVLDLGDANNRWKTVYYGTLNPSSDIRLKENIEDLENGLNKINSLDVKSFTFKDNPDHIEYGIIAQDTVSENPELISVPEDENGYYGIYLHNFVFLAVKAIQELSAKVSDLENKLEAINGN